MENPFSLTDEKLKTLLDAYTKWYKNNPKEEKYATDEEQKLISIREYLLNNNYLKTASNEDLTEKILKYSKTLEGPAHIRIGEPRVTGELENIKRNLLYLLDSNDEPIKKATRILDGDYKIPIFAKAFWTPIFQACYPKILPNWNNKTENFLKEVGVDIKTSKLTVEKKYKLLSDAFLYLQKIDPKQTFHNINHLMHYGTVIEEGKKTIEKIKDPKIFVDSFIELQKRIKKWSDGFKEGHKATLEAAPMTAHWYYSPVYDTFGPSKFIGYNNISLDEYVPSELDGRDTEQAISNLNEYAILKEDHSYYQNYKKKLAKFLDIQGLKAKSNSQIHISEKIEIRKLMFKLHEARELFSYKFVMLLALMNKMEDPSKSTHEYFWEFYKERKSNNQKVEKSNSDISKANFETFNRSQINGILDSPFTAINNCSPELPIIIKKDNDFEYSPAISKELTEHMEEMLDFIHFKIETYFNKGFDMGLKELFQTFAKQFKEETSQKAEKTLPIYQTLEVEGKRLVEDLVEEITPLDEHNIVQASIGQGNRTHYPWIAVLDSRVSNSVLTGYYIVYLFSDDCSEVYLTLNQGSTQQSKEEIQNNRELVFAAINEIPGFIKGELPSGSVVKTKTGSSAKNGRAYEKTNMFYKKYLIDGLPEESELIADLEAILKAYKSIITQGDSRVMDKTFFEFLSKEGLYFDEALVKRFILSLKTKPFVILTGNSGTGKTKLAQAFARYIDQKIENKQTPDDEDELLSKRWFKLSFNDKNVVQSFQGAGKKIDQIRNVILNEGLMSLGWLDNDDDREPKQKDMMRSLTEGDVIVAYQGSFIIAGIGVVTQSHFVDDGGDAFEAFNETTSNFIRIEWKYKGPLSLKDFKFEEYKVPGFAMWVDTIHQLSESQIERFTQHLNSKGIQLFDAGWKQSLPCYTLIPVGANWTDKRHLLGFENVIIGSYQKTKTLDLILEASNSYSDNESKPFFIILDEMNLSHVERYFADFLSAMESDEKIPLHDNDEIDQTQGIPKELSIPRNLYVIGTVNVDETTYMFSPKVLDRANVIEFNTIPARRYLQGDLFSEVSSFEFEFPGDITVRDKFPNEILKIMENIKIPSDDRSTHFKTKISYEIQSFQQALEKGGFDFGFRVINEIIRYLYSAWETDGKPDPWSKWADAFDAQILQKMIPKIHGPNKQIKDMLKCLYCYCFSGKTDEQLARLVKGEFVHEIFEKDFSQARYPMSAKKLKEMQNTLDNQRYVSFT